MNMRPHWRLPRPVGRTVGRRLRRRRRRRRRRRWRRRHPRPDHHGLEQRVPARPHKATQDILSDFTRKTGIKAKLVAVPEDQLSTLITNAAAAGNLPDVVARDARGGVARLRPGGALRRRGRAGGRRPLGPTRSPRRRSTSSAATGRRRRPSDGWGSCSSTARTCSTRRASRRPRRSRTSARRPRSSTRPARRASRSPPPPATASPPRRSSTSRWPMAASSSTTAGSDVRLPRSAWTP